MGPRARVVERQKLGNLIGVVPRPRLVDSRHAPMQVTPAIEREAAVGNIPEQGVAEAPAARRIAIDKLAQALPGSRVVFLTQGPKQLIVKGGAQHRCLSQQAPVIRRQAVDARADNRLNRLGHLVVRTIQGRDQKLAKEQRVSPSALYQGADARGVQARPPRHALGQLDAAGRGQRPDVNGDGAELRGGDESAGVGPPRHADEPWALAHDGGDAANELGRGLVHPMHVLERDQVGLGQAFLKDRDDDLRHPVPPERRVELVGLDGWQHVDAERSREQRQPGQDLGRILAQPSGQQARVGCRVAARVNVEQRPHHVAERGIGRELP